MGMFATIHVKTPLICPVCGAAVQSFQTKEFACLMAHLKIGSVLSGSSVMTGIVKDSLWCEACYQARRASGEQADPPPEPHVYLVIWHSISTGETGCRRARMKARSPVDCLM